MLSGPGVGDSIIPSHSTTKPFVFSGVPSEAKGVIVSYLIGTESGGDRRWRFCKVTPDNILFGHRSEGDGKAEMMAGTATIPYNNGVSQSIYCHNPLNKGIIKIIGVIY